MFVLVRVLYFVDVKNLALINCFSHLRDCIRHQCAMAWGSYGLCQEGSSSLHWEVPAEEMDHCPDASSLPSSARFLRGAHVSNTSFGEELSFSSLLWTWSPGHVKLDAHLQPLQVSGVICAHEWSGASAKGFIYPASAGGLCCDIESEREQKTCSAVYWQQRLSACPGIID